MGLAHGCFAALLGRVVHGVTRDNQLRHLEGAAHPNTRQHSWVFEGFKSSGIVDAEGGKWEY